MTDHGQESPYPTYVCRGCQGTGVAPKSRIMASGYVGYEHMTWARNEPPSCVECSGRGFRYDYSSMSRV